MFTTMFCPPPHRKSAALAAMLAAVLIATPVGAQQTGMINVLAQAGWWTFENMATINGNREWLVNYTANLNPAIETSIATCAAQKRTYPSTDCTIESPYIMKYGELDRSTCLALTRSVGGTPTHSQATLRGNSTIFSFTSWSQTVRARPDTSYCLAVYVINGNSLFYQIPLSAASFITPADPNPPASPAWMPNPFNTGCGTETTLALVRQCFQCKGGGGSWSMSANTCGN